MVRRFSRLFFSAFGVRGRARQLARDWWIRGMRRSELRNAPFQETSRKGSKEGGAENWEGRSAEPQGDIRRTARELFLGGGLCLCLRGGFCLSFFGGVRAGTWSWSFELVFVSVAGVVRRWCGPSSWLWWFCLLGGRRRGSAFPSGRKVARVVCGGLALPRSQEESARESSPTTEAPRGCR